MTNSKNNNFRGEIEKVKKFITSACTAKAQSNELFFGDCVRKAIDQVIDGPRTQRFSFDQLDDRPEKTFVGMKIEDYIRVELGLDRGKDHGVETDLWIANAPVDVKTSANTFQWMFPVEAVENNQICLVIHYNDTPRKQTNLSARSFGVGLLRRKNL